MVNDVRGVYDLSGAELAQELLYTMFATGHYGFTFDELQAGANARLGGDNAAASGRYGS